MAGTQLQGEGVAISPGSLDDLHMDEITTRGAAARASSPLTRWSSLAVLVIVAILTALLAPSAHAHGDRPDWLYRVDTRDPDTIFAEGFAPRGDDLNLMNHVTLSDRDPGQPLSGFVALTADMDMAVRLASLYLDGLSSDSGEEPRLHIYTVAPNESLFNVYGSLMAHADDAVRQGADNSYVLGVRSAARTIAEDEQEWATTTVIEPRSIREAVEWSRADGEDTPTDEISNDDYDPSLYGTVSTSPYRWNVPPADTLPSELLTLELPITHEEYIWVSPSLFDFFDTCPSSTRSNTCSATNILETTTLTRLPSGSYIPSIQQLAIPRDSGRCALSVFERSQWCDTYWTQTVSSDGWQRQTVKWIITRDAASDLIQVTYMAVDLEYYWGVRWHTNKYPVDVTISLRAETLDGRPIATQPALVRRENGGGFSVTVGQIVQRDDPFILRAQTHTSGMWWSDHESSDINHSQIFLFG